MKNCWGGGERETLMQEIDFDGVDLVFFLTDVVVSLPLMVENPI